MNSKMKITRTKKMKWDKKNDIFALMCGHGTQTNGVWDCGCTYGDYTEAELMLAITKVAVKWLRKSGVRVISDADTNNNKNIIECVKWANNTKGCKAYMSLHCDYQYQKKGIAPLYVSAEGKEMATTVGKYVAKKMGMTWRGAFKRTDLHELNQTSMTAVIFECGAIKADLKYLKDYKKYGKVVAKGICKYIGVPFYVSPATTRRKNFAKKANSMFNTMLKKKFKYTRSWTDCALDWKGALKKKKSNCSCAVSYVLQQAGNGYLKDGQIFWLNGDKVSYRGKGAKKQLAKVATILHPHKPPKKAGLKVGDICGYKNNPHTMIFAGWSKNGYPLWDSVSTSDLKAKKFPRHKKSYDNKTISTIVRLK